MLVSDVANGKIKCHVSLHFLRPIRGQAVDNRVKPVCGEVGVAAKADTRAGALERAVLGSNRSGIERSRYRAHIEIL
jgi:hypothetical protein